MMITAFVDRFISLATQSKSIVMQFHKIQLGSFTVISEKEHIPVLQLLSWWWNNGNNEEKKKMN